MPGSLRRAGVLALADGLPLDDGLAGSGRKIEVGLSTGPRHQALRADLPLRLGRGQRLPRGGTGRAAGAWRLAGRARRER